MSQKRRKTSCEEPRGQMDPELAADIAESMDLPDGAFLAMFEELSGGDYIDYADVRRPRKAKR